MDYVIINSLIILLNESTCEIISGNYLLKKYRLDMYK